MANAGTVWRPVRCRAGGYRYDHELAELTRISGGSSFEWPRRYRVLRHRRRGRARVAHSDSQLSGTRQATLGEFARAADSRRSLTGRGWNRVAPQFHFERHAARLRYGGERSRQRPVDGCESQAAVHDEVVRRDGLCSRAIRFCHHLQRSAALERWRRWHRPEHRDCRPQQHRPCGCGEFPLDFRPPRPRSHHHLERGRPGPYRQR